MKDTIFLRFLIKNYVDKKQDILYNVFVTKLMSF